MMAIGRHAPGLKNEHNRSEPTLLTLTKYDPDNLDD